MIGTVGMKCRCEETGLRGCLENRGGRPITIEKDHGIARVGELVHEVDPDYQHGSE